MDADVVRSPHGNLGQDIWLDMDAKPIFKRMNTDGSDAILVDGSAITIVFLANTGVIDDGRFHWLSDRLRWQPDRACWPHGRSHRYVGR